ncbi:MAG: hypothetical protein OHK0046_43570 [Anaerolineae bacterium]
MTQQETRKTNRSGQLSGVQIMFAAILAIGLILGINFSTRLAGSREQINVYENVEQEIADLQQVQATLVAELAYAQSEAFVERWAREDGKMVRPGEILVVPLPLGNSNALPTPTPQIFVEVETSPPKPENWTLWWALFFDSPPPEFN